MIYSLLSVLLYLASYKNFLASIQSFKTRKIRDFRLFNNYDSNNVGNALGDSIFKHLDFILSSCDCSKATVYIDVTGSPRLSFQRNRRRNIKSESTHQSVDEKDNEITSDYKYQYQLKHNNYDCGLLEIAFDYNIEAVASTSSLATSNDYNSNQREESNSTQKMIQYTAYNIAAVIYNENQKAVSQMNLVSACTYLNIMRVVHT